MRFSSNLQYPSYNYHPYQMNTNNSVSKSKREAEVVHNTECMQNREETALLSPKGAQVIEHNVHEKQFVEVTQNGTYPMPDDIYLQIFSYCNAQDLARLVGVCKYWRKMIINDENHILWRHLCSRHKWLLDLASDTDFLLKLREIPSGWLRFVSIFAENRSKWEWTGSWDRNISQKLKATQDGARIIVQESTMNTSARTTFPIYNRTAKFFNIEIVNKQPNWNIAIGVANESFLFKKLKFCGFHQQNWSYASNGVIREFSLQHTTNVELLDFPTFDNGDHISLLVDILSNSITYFKNGERVYRSDTVTGEFPLYVTVTLHNTGDELVFNNDVCPLSKGSLMDLYRSLEDSHLRRYFKELADQVSKDPDQALVRKGCQLLQHICEHKLPASNATASTSTSTTFSDTI